MYKLNLGMSVESIEPLGFKGDRFHYRVREDFENKLLEIKSLGFYSVDVGVCGTYNAFDVDALLPEILDIIKRTGVKVNAFHLPFAIVWMDLCSLYEPDRVNFVEWIKSLIKKLEAANPTAFVLHPGQSGNEKDAEKMFDNLCKSADELASCTDKYVCIENMTRSLVLENVDQIKQFLSKTKKACSVLDVNHLYHNTQKEAILAIGDRLKTLHISDYDFICERHVLPFEGKINWMEVLATLEEIGYNGVFNYEVLAKYTPKQVKENYDKLFSEYNKMSTK